MSEYLRKRTFKAYKPKMCTIVTSEHDIQKQIISLLRRYDDILIVYTDIMSGLKFCGSQQSRLAFINYHKGMGYEKGVCDLVLFRRGVAWFVELKTAKGKLSPEQIAFGLKVTKLGYKHVVWRSLDDCQMWLKGINVVQ